MALICARNAAVAKPCNVSRAYAVPVRPVRAPVRQQRGEWQLQFVSRANIRSGPLYQLGSR